MPCFYLISDKDDYNKIPSRVSPMTALGVRRDKAALSQWVQAPPGNPLQPEATGATVEVTKRLKPLVKRAAKYGGSASVQAVTRVNAEQASKRTLRRPTRLPYRGRLICQDGMSDIAS